MTAQTQIEGIFRLYGSELVQTLRRECWARDNALGLYVRECETFFDRFAADIAHIAPGDEVCDRLENLKIQLLDTAEDVVTRWESKRLARAVVEKLEPAMERRIDALNLKRKPPSIPGLPAIGADEIALFERLLVGMPEEVTSSLYGHLSELDKELCGAHEPRVHELLYEWARTSVLPVRGALCEQYPNFDLEVIDKAVFLWLMKMCPCDTEDETVRWTLARGYMASLRDTLVRINGIVAEAERKSLPRSERLARFMAETGASKRHVAESVGMEMTDLRRWERDTAEENPKRRIKDDSEPDRKLSELFAGKRPLVDREKRKRQAVTHH